MGRHCPAQIHYVFGDDQIMVKFTSSHHGHELDPAHVGLTSQTYEAVAQDLSKGVPKEIVCRDVGEKETPTKKTHRYNLISLKDVKNIANKFTLNDDGRYHEDDTISIDIFVKEQQERKDVIFTL